MTAAAYPERPLQPDDGRTGALGLFLLLASLAVFFASVLLAVWISSARAGDFSNAHAGLPPAIWGSTALLALLSWLMDSGWRKLNQGSVAAARLRLRQGFVIVIAFLLTQGWTWYSLQSRGLGATSGLYAFSFHLLTWMHAAHVLGGVVFHAMTLKRLELARNCAVYWHFLGLTWIAILITLGGTAMDDGPQLAGQIAWWLAWGGAAGMVVCWLWTVYLLWTKDGWGWGLLGLFPLFSVVFGWVRFEEHDNLRAMVAWQICIAVAGISYAMWLFLG